MVQTNIFLGGIAYKTIVFQLLTLNFNQIDTKEEDTEISSDKKRRFTRKQHMKSMCTSGSNSDGSVEHKKRRRNKEKKQMSGSERNRQESESTSPRISDSEGKYGLVKYFCYARG